MAKENKYTIYLDECKISEKQLRKALKNQAKIQKCIDDATARIKSCEHYVPTTLDKMCGYEPRKIDNHVKMRGRK